MNYEKHKKFFVTLAYTLVFATLGYLLLIRFFGVISPFVFAILFAALLNPGVDLFQKRLHLNRKLATLLLMLLFFGVFGTFLVACCIEAYGLVRDMLTDFLNNPNSFYASAQGLNMISKQISGFLHTDFDLVETVKNIVTPFAQWILGMAGNVAKAVPQIFVGTIAFFLASFFFIADREVIVGFCSKYVKQKHLDGIANLKKIGKDAILGYTKAQLILICITFAELLLGFTLMNLIGLAKLEYVVLIALGTAVLDALPLFGVGTVLLPWAVVRIVMGDFPLAIALLLQYGVCLFVRQMIEPKVLGESLGLHPLVTLLAVYTGLYVAGVAGMILFPIVVLFFYRLYLLGAFDELLKK